jgi:hypothetical protein
MRTHAHALPAAIAAAIIPATANAQTFTEQFRFAESPPASDILLGAAVDVAHGLAAIGSRPRQSPSSPGVTYVIDLPTQTARYQVNPAGGQPADLFGADVALNADYLAVGAPRADPSGLSSAGILYIYDAQTGNPLNQIVANDAAASLNLGEPIALDGATVFAGADVGGSLPGPGTFRQGAVYAFNAPTGTQLAKITGSDTSAGHAFGYGLDTDPDTRRLVIGAPGNGDGAVYVFDLDTLAELRVIKPNDLPPNAQFGFKVGIDDGVIAVGTNEPELAYLYDAETGQRLHTLLPESFDDDAQFGRNVAIADGIAAVAAPSDFLGIINPDLFFPGYVEIFDVDTGNRIARLEASGPPDDGRMGLFNGLAVGSGFVVAGAPQEFDSANLSDTFNAGAAYFFAGPAGVAANPDDLIVDAGDTATLSITSAGLNPAVQWRRDGVPLSDSANITGTNSDTLQITNASPADAGLYDAVVSNQFESVASAEAILSVRDTCPNDTNGDSTIGLNDLLNILSTFGSNCP